MNERRWKAKHLAEATGISLQGVYSIIKGERWPGSPNLDRIADAFEIPIADLFKSEATAPSSPTVEILIETVAKLSTRIKDLETQLKAQRRAVGETIALDRIKALEADAEAWRAIPEPLRAALAAIDALNEHESGLLIDRLNAIIATLDDSTEDQVG